MSEAEANSSGQINARDEEQEYRRAAGVARLLPAVNFGLRAAVLAGVVVVTGASLTPAAPANAAAPAVTTTIGLGGPISGLLGTAETGCCGPN